MRGVTSSLGLEGEVEFHAADKGPHLGCCWRGRRKASPSRRERHRLNTAWRSLTTVAKALSEAPLGAPDRGVSSTVPVSWVGDQRASEDLGLLQGGASRKKDPWS